MAPLTRSLATSLVVAAAVLVLPASAAAKLPVTKNHTIVPNQSLGGVTLGMTKAKAIKKWGSRPRCLAADTNGVSECLWEPRGIFGDGGHIAVRRGRVIVVGVSISSNMKPSAIRTLRKFKTVGKHIHIGSSKAAVRHAYPGAKVPPGEAGSPFLQSCNVNCTWFGGLGPKVERISVSLRTKQGYR